MGFINTFQRMSVDELRGEVIGLLKQSYTDGRIGVDTLERRLKDATVLESKDELLSLISDIPSPEGSTGDAGGAEEERTWLVNDRVPRESQTFFAVLGASNRTGRWQPARNINCFALMGGVKLDLREAEFPRSGIRVNAGCVMGGVEIILPPGINAEISGLPLLGGMENRAGSGSEDAPLVSVRGVAVMGGVEIKRREIRSKDRKGRKRNKGR